MIALLVAGTCLSPLSLNQEGAKIAFVSNRDGNEEIYSMNADGSGVRRLTNHKARDFQPCWIEGGTKIAFTSNRTGNLEIFSINPDGSELDNLTNTADRDDSWPMWNIRYTQLHYVSKNRFYTVDPRLDMPRMLTDYPVPQDCQPALNMDGLTCAFLNKQNKLVQTYGWHTVRPFEIKIPAGKALASVLNPDWNHEGTYLAFNTGGPNPKLYFVEKDGDNLQSVTMEGSASDPIWMPGGDSLTFVVPGVGGTDIATIDLDAAQYAKGTPKATNLTNSPGNDREPAVWVYGSEPR